MKRMFNYCIPREYKDKETGKIKYCLCRGGEKMQVDTLDNIRKLIKSNLPKDALPWCQIFNNGYRVTRDNLDWKEWNGFTFIDIDSKLYYNNVRPFNVDKLLDAIINEGQYRYNYNLYAVHLSNSKLGYRIFWYWDCDKTEENFKKCCILSDQYTRDLFYSFGKEASEIINYKEGRSKVMDTCSNSVFQGTYVTQNEIYYSEFIDDENFGACVLDDIKVEDLYKNVVENINIDQHDYCKYVDKHEVNKSNVRYYPHQLRRCIYEALVVLFKDKDKVDAEWEYICDLLPEKNGHDKKFYLNEPDKNKWYDKTNSKTKHSLTWLDDFGYKYEDEAEYIYWRQFRNSWRKHCLDSVRDKWISFNKSYYAKENGLDLVDDKDDIEDFVEEIKKEYSGKSIFDKIFETNKVDDTSIDDQSYIDVLEQYRKSYYKTRWEASEFKHLCNGYEIAKDIVTYKMYADFYYRDKNNVPTIKYNILDDEINVYGYWPETGKMQYHTFKYGNEYTHWRNNDTFSNKATKTDLLEAVNKYAPRWHNYHVLKDYLNSLDLSKANEELLETWAIRYFDAEDSKYVREISKKFFIAAVKKQMIEDPTTWVFQHMLFLQGPSGCGKTFFLVTMFTIDGHSYILNKIDPNGKDNEIGPLIAKNWLIQFGESENLKKISVNAAKEFMDRINLGMKYQKKYENEQTTVYPRIMACRTSNDDVLFNDVSINDGDRRNWLIVCRTGINSCDEKLRELIKKEKDILWATAYKLYLENPDDDLELSSEAFAQLAEKQEEYKLITNEDVKEVFEEVMEREYLTNDKGFIQDEASFKKMLEKSDVALEKDDIYVSTMINVKSYTAKKTKINRIPSRWLNNYITAKYGINFCKVFKDYMKKKGFTYKQAAYNDLTLKCWCR